MREWLTGLMLTAAIGGGTSVLQIGSADWPAYETALVQAAEPKLRDTAPAAWLRDDPADSLYRAAREALNRGEFRSAASLFARIGERYPSSGYAADALYWEAFSRYRLGGLEDLRAARSALERQRAKYRKAATRGDAAALLRRIEGELARRGDPDAVARVREDADAAADDREATRRDMEQTRRDMERTERDIERAHHDMKHARRDACDDEDDVRIATINALLQMDEERAVPILKKVLARRDSGSACLRRKAVFLVAQKQTGETEDILLGAARTDPDPEVRSQAVFWLSQVSTDRAIVALDSILRNSKDRELQDKAIFALSQQDGPKAQQALRAYAERGDLDPELREKAIFWLGQEGSVENQAFLRGLYARLKEPELKNKVIFSLSQAGGVENRKWLVDLARNKTEPMETRKQALFWAGQGGVPIADLAALYEAMPDREMREQLIFVYSQRDDPAAVDKLVEIAKRDADPELRKKALFWLGQSGDPRATAVIQEILEQ